MGIADSRACGFSLQREVPISNDATLKRLVVSTGQTLISVYPDFQPDGLTYSASVPFTVKHLVITPVVNEAHAIVVVERQGGDLSRGSSAPVPVIAGVSPSVSMDGFVKGQQGMNRPVSSVNLGGPAPATSAPRPASTHPMVALTSKLEPILDEYVEAMLKEMEEADLKIAFDDINHPKHGEAVATMEQRRKDAERDKENRTAALQNEANSAEALLKRTRRSFRQKNVPVGMNGYTIVVTSQSGVVNAYGLNVERRVWDPEGWKLGRNATNKDKFKWYCEGASEGDPQAQFRLALMYSGEDGYVTVPSGHEADKNFPEPKATSSLTLGQDEDSDDPYNTDPASFVRLHEPIASVRAFKWLSAAAEGGHVPAQTKLADLYRMGAVPQEILDEISNERAINGLGNPVITDEELKKEAAKWYQEAAKQRNVYAASQLARLYIEGKGVSSNYEKAIYWLIRSGKDEKVARIDAAKAFHEQAEQGNANAAYQYSLMYIDGIGVPMDYKQAVYWMERSGDPSPAENVAKLFTEAGKKGKSDAAYQMALMRVDGVGAPMDYKKALMWLELAGKPSDVSYQLLIQWFTQAAEQGDARSAEQLAMMYVDGAGVHNDYKIALKWLAKTGEEAHISASKVAERLQQAAEKGSTKAAYQLALMYVDGVGVEMDYKKALWWLERAGTPSGPTTHKQAAEWFRQLAESNDKRAAYQLALMYIDGVGVPMNYHEALTWLDRAGQAEDFAQQLTQQRLQAAASGQPPNTESAVQLARMYEDYQQSLKWLVKEGRSEYEVLQQAAYWYQVAAQEGDVQASEKLAQMYIDWRGVAIDFKAAEYWFEKAGKSKEFIRKRVQAKLDSLKPSYEMLYLHYASARGGKIDAPAFAGFYRDCLMAKGMNQQKADEETVSVYQGRMKYELIFDDYDLNKDHSLDFEEVWRHPHTHTVLFPKHGKHVMSALKYFESWQTFDVADTVTQLLVKSGQSKLLFRATTSKIGSDTSAAPVIDRLVSRANATTPRAELTRIQTKLQRAATRMSQGSNMNLAAVVNRKDSAGSIRDFDADPSQDPDTGTGLGSFAPTPLTGPMSARTASGSSNSGAAGALFSPRTAAMNRQTSYAMVAPSFPGAAPPPGR